MGSRIRALMVAAWLIAAAVPAWAQGNREYVPEEEWQTVQFIGGFKSPMLCNGELLLVEGNPSDAPLIRRFGRNGELEHFSFTIPEGRNIHIYALACAEDGSMGVGGMALSSDGSPVAYLAVLEADRQKQKVVHLWPYVPRTMTFAPDGSIWTIGYIRNLEDDGVVQDNVMKRFDSEGELLATKVLTAKGRIISGDNPAKPRNRDATEFSELRASEDRIGWLTNGNEYIEFDFDGEVIRRFRGPECGDRNDVIHFLALSSTNDVIVRITACDDTYWRRNRNAGKWESVEVKRPKGAQWDSLLGFDGDTLVTASSQGVVHRYKPKAEQ